MDLVLKLRELRRLRGLTQRIAAERSGVGVKTISSFETGERIASMTLDQLQKLLRAYGVTLAQFFSPAMERELAPWLPDERSDTDRLTEAIAQLAPSARRVVIEKLQTAVDIAAALHPPSLETKGRRRAVPRRVRVRSGAASEKSSHSGMP